MPSPVWVAIVTDDFSRANTSWGTVSGSGVFVSPGTDGAYVDLQGSCYEISTNTLYCQPDSVDEHQWYRDLLLRPTAENLQDQQSDILFSMAYGNWCFGAVFRRQASGHFYCVMWAPHDGGGAAITALYFDGTEFTTIGTGVAAPWVSGHAYRLTSSVLGVSPTVISCELYDVTASASIVTGSWSDSTSDVQAAGQVGITNGSDPLASGGSLTGIFSGFVSYQNTTPPGPTEYIWEPTQTYIDQAAGMNWNDTVVTVSDSSLWTGDLPTRISIDSEIMMLTAISGEVFTVTRAQEGTIATVHANNAVVQTALTTGALYAVFELKTP